jgi:hypothetical protein
MSKALVGAHLIRQLQVLFVSVESHTNMTKCEWGCEPTGQSKLAFSTDDTLCGQYVHIQSVDTLDLMW